MPKGVTEVSDGNQFSRSANEGQLADSAARTFRVLLNSPDETFDIQQTCGVFIGDPHPINTSTACVNFDVKYEGDTRMVLVATFNYQSDAAASGSLGGGGGSGGQSPKTISPDVRPANWTISTELTEMPIRYWHRRTGTYEWSITGTQPLNPAGDMYDGVSTLNPMTSIKVSQFVLGGADDPTKHCYLVGRINETEMQLGTLSILPHTLMLRSINASPTVESWGSLIFRGWNVEYTFLLRDQHVAVNFDLSGEATAATLVNIGWDMAVILEGRNVACFNPATGAAWQDPFGQPLKPGDDQVPLDPANPVLCPPLTIGDRAPACVRTPGMSGRGVSQAVASSPIALNPDGTARKLTGARKPVIWAYQIHPHFDMVNTLQLRLY
jgi:hypothetical protein